jgi:hypothetical protein
VAKQIVAAARDVDALIAALPPEPSSANNEVGCTCVRDHGAADPLTGRAAATGQELRALQDAMAGEIARLEALEAAGRTRLAQMRALLDQLTVDMLQDEDDDGGGGRSSGV